MAINAQVLSEMEIPETYIETLPKVIFENFFLSGFMICYLIYEFIYLHNRMVKLA